jgi:hypothetical protein
MASHPDTWLHSSGQLWKVRVFAAGFAITAGCLCGLIWATSSAEAELFGLAHDALITLFALGLAGFGALSFGWILLSIRCNECGARPVWRGVNSEGSFGWFTELFNLRACPECQATGGRTSANTR